MTDQDDNAPSPKDSVVRDLTSFIEEVHARTKTQNETCARYCLSQTAKLHKFLDTGELDLSDTVHSSECLEQISSNLKAYIKIEEKLLLILTSPVCNTDHELVKRVTSMRNIIQGAIKNLQKEAATH